MSRPAASRSEPPATGIAALGLKLPPLGLTMDQLAELRGEDVAKYTIGLGCSEMALCPRDYGVADLAVAAAERALERWGGDRSRIGLLAVGTETAVDMSRPLSAWVAEGVGLSGAVRSYEVKHACYGGTLALRQATEWRLSGAARGQAALVVAADVALYAPEDPGEPTQGAGAVALVVDEPRVAALETVSHPWSEPAFDFWRPVGESFPRVDGPLSLDCYRRAAEHCFRAWAGEDDPAQALEALEAMCFHVPFPKMVRKAVDHLGEVFGWTQQQARDLYARKIEPYMEWNRRCGNSYTASLWTSVARALAGMEEGKRLTAFSYGSGFGAELLTLVAGPEAAGGAWAEDVEGDLAGRSLIDAATYQELRAS
jgi:hydroxymethylglutaryl-CoA synthase